MDIQVQPKLKSMGDYLMYKKFPYHSVSVIYRNQDLGFHVFFMENVKEMVTEEIKDRLDSFGFTFSFVPNNN
jgi:site-specific DNA-cytosine methylase